MCGRYYSLFDKQQAAKHFHVRRIADNVGIIAPSWNVAPGVVAEKPVSGAAVPIQFVGAGVSGFPCAAVA
jgi:hypothetical protein